MTSFSSADAERARGGLAVFAAILVAWTLAWWAKNRLDLAFPWLSQDPGAAFYWLAAKTALWIVPAWLLLRAAGGDVAEQANLRQWRRWCAWGTAVGLLLAVLAIVGKWQAGRPAWSPQGGYATINVLLVAPLFEEFLMRAAILGRLTPAWGFAAANVITSACFVALHVPGWAMMGTLAEKFSQPVGGAVSLFAVGLCFGWATHKGRSFLGGTIAHSLNNLAA
jgi:membrane protease YdiL (CAAX protease family)